MQFYLAQTGPAGVFMQKTCNLESFVLPLTFALPGQKLFPTV